MIQNKFDHVGPYVVLVEGKNDCHVILALRKHYSLSDKFGLFDCGSDEKLLKRASLLLVSSQRPEVIAIILDADNPDLSAKWASVKDRLEKEGYVVPTKPDLEGTIVCQDSMPTIGVWLMPDNNVDGMLEDFCAQLAPPDAMSFAGDCVKSAEDKNFSTFNSNHRTKAEVHTYLAWQDEPGRPLGQAITAKCLDPDHPVANRFASFLKRLFGEKK